MSNRRIITLDVGTSRVVMCGFEVKDDGSVQLSSYGREASPDLRGVDMSTAANSVLGIRELVKGLGLGKKDILVAIPAQTVFPRFVKLPPVGDDKLEKIVQYEAEQNVPFPIEEVSWCYKLFRQGDGGEVTAMIVAVKNDNLEEFSSAVTEVGMRAKSFEPAVSGLINAAMARSEASDGCTMVLDIGWYSTSVVFLEDGKLFFRSIPVAGKAITDDLSRYLEMETGDAEDWKVNKVNVSEETTDSGNKEARNVVCRLHAEINRSINFYKSQQGGNTPSRVLLTGGGSQLKGLPEYLSSKMNLPVSMFNPLALAKVSLSPSLQASGFDPIKEMPYLATSVGMCLGAVNKDSLRLPLEPQSRARKRAMDIRVAVSMAGAAVVISLLIAAPLFLMRNWKPSPGNVPQATSWSGQGDLVEQVASRDASPLQPKDKESIDVLNAMKTMPVSPGKVHVESMLLGKDGRITATGTSTRDPESVPGGWKLVGVEAIADHLKKSWPGKKILIVASDSSSGEAYDFQIVVLP